MSLVTFYPVPDCDQENGWPEKVIGDGFINLTLFDAYGDDGSGSSAIYSDQFKDEYEFVDPAAGEWTVDVREDGI